MVSVNRHILRSENLFGLSHRRITDARSDKKYEMWLNYRYDKSTFSSNRGVAFKNSMNLVEIGYDELNQTRFDEVAFSLFTSTGKKFDYVTGQGNTDSFAIAGYNAFSTPGL